MYIATVIGEWVAGAVKATAAATGVAERGVVGGGGGDVGGLELDCRRFLRTAAASPAQNSPPA